MINIDKFKKIAPEKYYYGFLLLLGLGLFPVWQKLCSDVALEFQEFFSLDPLVGFILGVGILISVMSAFCLVCIILLRLPEKKMSYRSSDYLYTFLLIAINLLIAVLWIMTL